MCRLMTIRHLATAVLVVVVGLFVLALVMERNCGGWGWSALKAFAEAATVGALADWFAVVALFRHPLGLPIPHTAVLVRKQDTIAKSIASFFCDNFWVPAEIRTRLLAMSPSRTLVNLLSKSQGAVSGLSSGILQQLESGLQTHRHALSTLLSTLLPTLPLKGALRGLVNGIRQSEFPNTAVDLVIAEASRYINANQRVIAGEVANSIQQMIGANGIQQIIPTNLAGGLGGLLGNGLGQLVGNGIRDTVGTLVASRVSDYADELAGNPHHPLRADIQRAVMQALEDIAEGRRYDSELTAALNSLCCQESVALFLESVLPLLKEAAADSSGERAATERLCAVLEANPELCAAADRIIAEIAAEIVARTAEPVAQALESTIRGWDMDTMVSKLEAQVGNDLQYIRLNGTFVGGLIGLLIYVGVALVNM